MPAAGPASVGVNTTERAQALLAAKLAPQGLVAILNGPVEDTLEIDTAAELAFSKVTGRKSDLLPIATWPKSRVPGNTLTRSAAEPVPANGTVTGPSERFPAMVRTLLAGPT